MIATAIHRGETMHATLSFAYPDDEQKLKDALNGEKYRNALEEVQKLIDLSIDSSPTIIDVKSVVDWVLREDA